MSATPLIRTLRAALFICSALSLAPAAMHGQDAGVPKTLTVAEDARPLWTAKSAARSGNEAAPATPAATGSLRVVDPADRPASTSLGAPGPALKWRSRSSEGSSKTTLTEVKQQSGFWSSPELNAPVRPASHETTGNPFQNPFGDKLAQASDDGPLPAPTEPKRSSRSAFQPLAPPPDDEIPAQPKTALSPPAAEKAAPAPKLNNGGLQPPTLTMPELKDEAPPAPAIDLSIPGDRPRATPKAKETKPAPPKAQPAAPSEEPPTLPFRLPSEPATPKAQPAKPEAKSSTPPSLLDDLPLPGTRKEKTCERMHNDRNCCDDDSKCTSARRLLRENSIKKISLDIMPSFKPDAATEQEKLEARDNKLREMPNRQWRNRAGEVVAEGRVLDLKNQRLNIAVDGKEAAVVPVAELSDDDLCFLAAWWGIPTECPLGDDELLPRSWEGLTFTWTAPALCHKPLYFEERQLERYNHGLGPFAQPVLSGAHFFLNVAVLPYKMGINPPGECQYPLGYYRPGNCAPRLLPPIPISLRGGLAEAGAVTGLIFLIP